MSRVVNPLRRDMAGTTPPLGGGPNVTRVTMADFVQPSHCGIRRTDTPPKNDAISVFFIENVIAANITAIIEAKDKRNVMD